MRRLPQLDGVRGIAILLVLIWHYYCCQIMFRPHSLVWYGGRLFSLTWSGVDLFFVLSGFLIAGVLLDHRETSNYFRVFYLRRVCRIFPLYFLLLALFVWLRATRIGTSPSMEWLFSHPLPLLSYATFTQNIFMGAREEFGAMWLGITWSLAVEEQFYIVVPLLIYFLPRRALLWVLVPAILAAPVLRSAFPGFQAFVNTPWRSDSLLSGVALAVLVRSPPFLAAVRRHHRTLLGSLAVLLAGAAVLILRAAPIGPLDQLLLAALYSVFVLVAFVDAEPHLGRFLRSAVLVWFGQHSYGIYMFHQAVSGLLYGVVRGRSPQMYTITDAGITLTALAITLLLAWVSYRVFEGPILRLGHRVPYRRNVSGDPALAPGGVDQ